MGLSNPWIKRVGTYLFKDHVYPQPGSILYVKLVGIPFAPMGTPEHTGVYIGNNKIVELNGDGSVQRVSLEGFLNYGGLPRVGLFAYVACDKYGNVLYDHSIAQNAIDETGTGRNYNVLFNNCHQFSSGCITGNFKNGDNQFWKLEKAIKKHYGVSKIDWRTCQDLT